MRFKLVIVTLVLCEVFFGCHKREHFLHPSTTGAIAGKVTDGSGSPVSQANIFTQPPSSSVTSDVQGNYRIVDLSPDTYTVTALKGDSAASRQVVVRAGETTVADIPLGMGNHPPGMPIVLSPQDQSTNQSTTVTLSWSCSDPEGDPLLFDVFFGNTNPPTTLIASNLQNQTYVRSGLDTSTTYYWRVVAKDNHLGFTSGPIWSFRTSSGGSAVGGLMAYYPFDGNGIDASGNGNHGTAFGVTPTADRFERPAGALLFNGIYSSVSIPSSSSLHPNDQLTMTFWIRIDALTNNYSPIIHKGGQVQGYMTNREYAVYIKANFSNQYFQIYSAGDNSGQHEVLSSTYTLRQWLFIAAVIDRRSHHMSVYINGQLDNDAFDSYSTFNANGFPLTIGTEAETIWPDHSPFQGALDEVRLYNRALTSAEIRSLYGM